VNILKFDDLLYMYPYTDPYSEVDELKPIAINQSVLLLLEAIYSTVIGIVLFTVVVCCSCKNGVFADVLNVLYKLIVGVKLFNKLSTSATV